jgi:transcriptional regulator with GAF, ATPase, and Fis domain
LIQPQDVGLKSSSGRAGLWDESIQELPYKVAKEKTLQQFNNAYIGHAMANSQGNITQAAHASGMERQALQQIMRRYNIEADKFRR